MWGTNLSASPSSTSQLSELDGKFITCSYVGDVYTASVYPPSDRLAAVSTSIFNLHIRFYNGEFSNNFIFYFTMGTWPAGGTRAHVFTCALRRRRTLCCKLYTRACPTREFCRKGRRVCRAPNPRPREGVESSARDSAPCTSLSDQHASRSMGSAECRAKQLHSSLASVACRAKPLHSSDRCR